MFPSLLVRRETLKSRDKRPFFSPRNALQRNPSLCASLRNRLLFDIEAPEALGPKTDDPIGFKMRDFLYAGGILIGGPAEDSP